MGGGDDRALARLFELSADLHAIIDGDRFAMVNPAWKVQLGWEPEQLVGRPVSDFIHPDDLDRSEEARTGPDTLVHFENRYLHRDGGHRWLSWSARRIDDTWYATGHDVTDHRRLEHEALHDSLTSLPNRLLFADRLEHALARRRRSGGTVAVMFCDLDRFKAINDTYGHEVGNAVLVATAERLRGVVRDMDTVARFGGDEFVVLAEGLRGHNEVIALARRIVEAIGSEPFAIRNERLELTTSVGVATAFGDEFEPEQLLREADMAMYRVKGVGRAGYQLFDDQMRVEVHDRLRTSADLRRAIPGGELRIVFQPIVLVSDGSVVGCEALVRWQHPERGMLGPASFVPLAEDNGLIVPLGAWVLEAACSQAATWRRMGRDFTMSVNIASAQLHEPGFLELVERTLKRTGLPAPSLCLELTETTAARRPEKVIDVVRSLKRLGVRIAIDDFGRGFSSLLHFRTLPVDVVKLDRSFVAGLRDGVDDRAIVVAMLSLSQQMGMDVVAEGVESAEQLAELQRLGVELAQGFYFARPAPGPQLDFGGFNTELRPGLGDPFVIREFMRQIGIPARIR